MTSLNQNLRDMIANLINFSSISPFFDQNQFIVPSIIEKPGQQILIGISSKMFIRQTYNYVEEIT